MLSKKLFCRSRLPILISVFLLSCSNSSDPDIDDIDPILNEDDDVVNTVIDLNLRIHIMTDITMVHPTGSSMDSWVSPSDVTETIVPEINAIWEQADIRWIVESIIEEDVVKHDTYEASINFIVNTKRDSEGRSDPARLPHLYALMQPQYRSKANQLGENLFHIYLFPFIGNTSQGNAMRSFDFHSVVGTWTNKHNGGGIPEKTLLTENRSSFIRGSLSRTISHEIGHVLNLRHNECNSNCLMGGGSDGYSLTNAQITTARLAALDRL